MVKSRQPKLTPKRKRELEDQERQASSNKIRIFDLMAAYSLLSTMPLYGGRLSVQFVPDYKDHTDLIAERPGAPGAKFEWWIPAKEGFSHGTQDVRYLTSLSEEWEFDTVSEALDHIRDHIKQAVTIERKRNAVLRSLTPEQRKLIGKGDWRDPREDGEEEDGSIIPEDD